MIDVSVRQTFRALTLEAAFAAPAGVTALFGPSGAGKTSVLRAVAGLSSPDEVRVILDGTDLAALPARARRIGYVFQDARLFPHLSVQQNLRYGGQHHAARIVEMLGLGDLLHRRPRHLSGGETQRVAIGRALMSNPRLLLLDEPLASLDAARKAAILPYLERLRDDAGVPILHVSHDLAEVTRLATTLVVLSAGRVVASGPLEDVLRDPAAATYLGPRQLGAVIHMQVSAHDAADDVTTLTCAAGPLLVPGQLGPIGRDLRLRILAHDVILARHAPVDVSALNVLPVTVTNVSEADGGLIAQMTWGQEVLLARVTRRSAKTLGLASGMALYAMVKASAVSAG